MNRLRKTGHAVWVILLLVSVLGLYFYLKGPQESSDYLSARTKREIVINGNGNETVALSPFQRNELSEYYAANLSEFLLNRTIDIELEVPNGSEITFSLMNFSQSERWKNGSASEIIFQNLNSTQLTFSPQDRWGFYFIVLQNNGNSDIAIRFRIKQLFGVRIFDYESAFNWLIISFFSGIASFVLQLYLKMTPGHIWRRVEYFITPEKYRAYIVKSSASFIIVILILGTILFGASVFMTVLIDQANVFIGPLLKDYVYRFCIGFLFLVILLISILRLALTLWNLSGFPLLANYYPDQELKKKMDEAFIGFLNKYLSSPFSLIFYLGFGVWMIIVFRAEIRPLLLMFIIGVAPFLIFLGYVSTQVELKIQKTVLAAPFENWENDYNFYKAVFGSGLIISFVTVYALQYVPPFVEPISQFILDRGILAMYSHGSWLFGSAQVLSEIKQSTSLLAYFIPLGFLIVYNSLILFTIAPYLSKSITNDVYLQKASIILKDSLLDLIFFIITFLSSIWLQSQVVQIGYRQVSISLVSSFIAMSFKNYLQALGKIIR